MAAVAPVAAAAAAAVAAPDLSMPFIKNLFKIVENYPGAGLKEIIRILPDGLLLGSGLLAILTQNYAYSILCMTIFEALFITVGLRKFFSYMDLPNTLPTGKSASENCVSGFVSPSLDTLSFFFNMSAESAFPSVPVFIFSIVSSYLVFSMMKFIPELNELGSAFSARFYLGLIMSFIMLFIVSMVRMINNCESFGVILMSLLVGYGLGYVFYYQNLHLFGTQSVNIMNIPFFTNKTDSGQPLYICPTVT
jgi:hypothetical protein